jgi:hypothetical protein
MGRKKKEMAIYRTNVNIEIEDADGVTRTHGIGSMIEIDKSEGDKLAEEGKLEFIKTKN